MELLASTAGHPDSNFIQTDKAPLKPKLASIPDACRYMGGISRAKFYADILPLLDSVYFDARHFVVVASMDRLIAAKTKRPQHPQRPKPKSLGPSEASA
jgi:hypothetical protein